jgi:hypothetical protein
MIAFYYNYCIFKDCTVNETFWNPIQAFLFKGSVQREVTGVKSRLKRLVLAKYTTALRYFLI